MWDKVKIFVYMAIPFVLYFLVMFVKSRMQKERILDLARSYVKKETKLKQEKIRRLEQDYANNQEEISKLKDSVAKRKFELAKKYRKEGLRDKDILDLFGD
jgi:hypothetical protein